MDAFAADPKTREYIGTVPAAYDPLTSKLAGEPVFRAPACASLNDPRPIGDHEAAFLLDDDDTWEKRIDYRGIYYDTADGSRQEITETGVDPDPAWTDQVPGENESWDAATGQWAADIDAAKTLKRMMINQWRTEAIDAGVEYAGVRYDTDAVSRDNITGTLTAVQAGVPLPDGFTWRSEDNQDIPMTVGNLAGLSAVVLAHVNTCYQRSWALKAEVDAAETVAEVDAVVWS